jgi:hypothetical protein
VRVTLPACSADPGTNTRLTRARVRYWVERAIIRPVSELGLPYSPGTQEWQRGMEFPAVPNKRCLFVCAVCVCLSVWWWWWWCGRGARVCARIKIVRMRPPHQDFAVECGLWATLPFTNYTKFPQLAYLIYSGQLLERAEPPACEKSRSERRTQNCKHRFIPIAPY